MPKESTAPEAILAALPATIAELARSVSMARGTIAHALYKLSKSKQVHITGWRSPISPVWAAGDAPNATRPGRSDKHVFMLADDPEPELGAAPRDVVTIARDPLVSALFGPARKCVA